MKKAVIFCMLIAVTTVAMSQVQIFGKYTAETGKTEPDINIFGYGPRLDSAAKLKITYFALVEKTWAEALVGIAYSPAPWCEIGIMIGLETVPSAYRLSSSIWLGNDKTSFSACVEKGDGRDNWWYKSTAAYNLNANWSAGLMSWRYNGTGVFVKYTTNRKLSFWANPAYDLEFNQKRLTVGVDIKI